MNRIHWPIYALMATMLAGSFLKANAQQYECRPAPKPGYKLFVIDAHSMTLTEGTTQYDNNTSLWIVVENINPFVSTYTLSVKRTAVTEPAIAAFLGDIGGVVGDFLPKQSPAPASSTPGQAAPQVQPGPPACSLSIQTSVFDKFGQFGKNRDKVADALNRVTSSYQTASKDLAKQLGVVHDASKCLNIQTEATALRTQLEQIKSPDLLEAATFSGTPNEQDPTQLLQGEILKLIQEAKGVQSAMLDYRRQLATHAECDSPSPEDAKQFQAEEDFLGKFLGPTTGTPESQVFLNQLNTLKDKYSQFTQARSALANLFNRGSSPNPFVLTNGSIINEKQADDEIILEAGAPVSVIDGQGTKTNANPAPPPSAPTKTASTTKAAFDQVIHFGYGPRFTISGGIVTSFLENKQYTTANGQIAYQNNSRTRILPIAALNGRFHDCNPDTGVKCLLVPQISFGITAKSDDKGTSPEYLVGPSWAFIDRQLFITLGAYAGQQQRLLGGLAVGQTTSLSAANLPIAKEYHWSGAIAITWKLK
ncbi:MAG TPA: hypothetical protein VNH19_11610 [Candidatus Limnocylindrales bacterium]|nr:hypothetical protein [Candidatus Limnocylindrales bacterium]